MDFTALLTDINMQIGKLEQVRSILISMAPPELVSKHPSVQDPAISVKGVKARKARALNPDARKRIAEGQKRRWAKKRAFDEAILDTRGESQQPARVITEAAV